MTANYFITGATGFVGGHMAEACVARGLAVCTIARPSSDTALLEKLGVRIHRGDLKDIDVVRQALDEATVVIHCAAKVGDWGPVEDYRAVNVEALRGLLEACKGRKLERFVHMSSLGVFAARHHYGTDELVPPPPMHIDGYTQTKVEAEELAVDYFRVHDVPVVVLRPGFIYGQRDRTVLPRLIGLLREGQVRYLGDPDAVLNTIYIGNVVDAIFLSIEKPLAVGRTYNLTDGERVSKRRFIEAVADGMELTKPTKTVPLWLARLAAWWMEGRARARGDKEAPRLTQARVKFLGLNLDFSIERARKELGYRPRFSFDDAIKETMVWYRQTA
jgi:nucleoside-diphosphate-sugar epimerase